MKYTMMSWFYENGKRIDLPTEIVEAKNRFEAYDKWCKVQGKKVHCGMLSNEGYFEVIPGVVHNTWRTIG